MLLLRILLPIGALLMLTACQKNASSTQAGSAESTTATQSSKSDRLAFSVRTAPVTTRKVTYEMEAVGSLMEENRFEIPAQVDGVVDHVNFAEGDAVTTGQELCRVDYTRNALQLRQAQNALVEKEAALHRALASVSDVQRETSSALETSKVALDLAQGEFKRRAVSGANSFTSSEEREQFEAKYRQAQNAYRDAINAAGTQVALAKAQTKEAQAALETARTEVALVKDNLARSIVKAPIAGVIQKRSVVEGEYVDQGDTMALMVQSDPLRLRFTVPESRAERLSKNMRLDFTVSAYANRTFSGQVYDIGAFADQDTREVICWAHVSNNDARLKPGFFTHVNLRVDSKDKAMVVPLASVLPTELGMTAYVVEDGAAVRRGVKTGLHVTGDAIEVLSGLDPGEELVVQGMNALQNGVPVKVLPNLPSNVNIDKETAATTAGIELSGKATVTTAATESKNSAPNTGIGG